LYASLAMFQSPFFSAEFIDRSILSSFPLDCRSFDISSIVMPCGNFLPAQDNQLKILLRLPWDSNSLNYLN
jgi:hypothetical protein